MLRVPDASINIISSINNEFVEFTGKAIKIPIGNSDERPSSVESGLIRYNTTDKTYEGYSNDNWGTLGGVKDGDGDTYITSDNNDKDDTDQLTFFTAGVERMKIDESGGIFFTGNVNFTGENKISLPDDISLNTLDVSNSITTGNLDISSTDALLIPRGTTDERPSDIEEPRALRSNKDTKLYEVYTESNIWSGIPLYKTEQPPKLLNVSQNKSNQKTTVSWSKFEDIYKDVFDGKCYPIYLQTFIDISFTIGSTSSDGWKTLIIGNGNYNQNGEKTTPSLSHDFNSISQKSYTNNTDYDILFTDKPTTTNLPAFTQEDSFDLRIYGVNKSGTIPNYIYIYSVQLKQTGQPGEVSVILFESFGKTNFNVDLSFNLDSIDVTITGGISIAEYDISFTLIETKSS